MLQLHAIALNQSVLESRWKAEVLCSQFDTAQLKPKHFCAGNRASGLSPCFKRQEI